MVPPDLVLVASFLLRASDAGESVVELYDELISALIDKPDAQVKVHGNVMGIIGSRLREARSCRFDRASAINGLRLIPAARVPRLEPPFPVGVSQVHFVSDLSSADGATVEELDSHGLWGALHSPWIG
jgi:hypothetical protein